MRVVIGCLAAVGVVTLLVIAGCVGLISFGVARAVKDIPSYATRDEISRRHAADLALITDAISRRQYDGLAEKLSPEVVALYRDNEELLHRQVISGKSYSLMNNGGVGTLTVQGRTIDCVVIGLDAAAGAAKQEDHHVFFIDRQAQSVERP